MAEYSVEALWQRGTQDFLDHRYSRRHVLRFEADPLPTRTQVEQMHELAHQDCFIANSVKTTVRCEPVFPTR